MSNIIRTRSPKRAFGQGMTEYIIIVALIAIAAIAVVSLFGGTVRSQMAGMAQEMGGTSANAQVGKATNAGNKAATVSNAAHNTTNLGNYDKAASSNVQ
jgi:pilus assembly protein Flp/PilA